jgi:hypothetical protein
MRRRLPLILLMLTAVTAASATPGVEEFVTRHWRAPLPAQGPAPARFSPTEASLAPDACGGCHPAQLGDWRTSVHARSMGPGITGQLVEMLHGDPRGALGCYTCHAPLAEQRPGDPAFDPALAAQGLVCAGCHVRAHEHFGPPRRDGSLESAVPRESLPHGGVSRTPAFLASEFCRGCHQFAPGGLALNGKLLENTYEEWKASRFAREGTQCQDCHMPDRRHLWRGIHDPEMVRSGLRITTGAASLHVESVRIGHRFPTYVVPRVILRAELLDADGRAIAGTRREHVIAREVTLDLEREVRDTRLVPGATARLDYRAPYDPRARRIRFRVIVEPDAFYTKFFTALLEQGAGRGEEDLTRARNAARRSPYTLFTRDVALPSR